MKAARLADVKNQLSRYVERARRGERVLITIRGVPVAQLAPLALPPEGADDPLLDELERAGVIRRGRRGLDAELLKPGPRARGKPLSRVVQEQRKERP